MAQGIIKRNCEAASKKYSSSEKGDDEDEEVDEEDEDDDDWDDEDDEDDDEDGARKSNIFEEFSYKFVRF